jgi:hypothetical protein
MLDEEERGFAMDVPLELIDGCGFSCVFVIYIFRLKE